MNVKELIVVVLMLVYVADGGKRRNRGRTKGARWWNLANTPMMMSDDIYGNQVFINPSLQPLTRKQRRLVTKNPGTIVAIAKGARVSVDECRFQFHDRRWNCPISDDSHGQAIFGKILRKGCRETAFIYAITSAAVTHSVAMACSEGSIYTCSCATAQTGNPNEITKQRDWEWGGCSDNAHFGYKFSKDFVDVVEKGRDLRFMMNLHNNEAGRLHVTDDLRQECKCHGMSGSCTIKTCWMRLPVFRRVGDAIKDKFDGASKVLQDNAGRSSRSSSSSTRFNLMPVDKMHKPPSPTDLVYYEASPNFCSADSSVGFSGTTGRECNASSIGVDGCDLMCCGRGFRTESYEAKERCNCVFHWCCEVTCDTCKRTRLRHICN